MPATSASGRTAGRTGSRPGRTLRALRSVSTAVAATVLLTACSDDRSTPEPTPGSSSTLAATSAPPAATGAPGFSGPSGAAASLDPDVREVVTGLAAPWGLGFLPDGAAVLTQRDDARVLVIRDGGAIPVGQVDGVVAAGEGGLLGLAVSPTFAQDRALFVYYTAADDNRIDRVTLAGDPGGETLTDQRTVVSGIPKAGVHNGGRLRFGPDGYLYVGTGDASDRPAAQDLKSLGGKILRVTADGTGAPGNPFPEAPLVYSLGHRNVQGLDFDAQGRLRAAEFGQNTWDELNLVEAGGNYGWPDVEGPAAEGAATSADQRSPARAWPTDDASPSGLAVADGSVWMAGLRGERLWQIPLTADGTGEPIAHLTGEWGRLRTVEPAPDGTLWVTTSNTDGRGDVRDGDDRILALTLS
ncbi:PQQ-dependent sugar dehydrogenase [Nakamurella flava]|uniref:PQQ-dependent sugar dehydrogenase n=2 Tax=Nakamurella flava TaxID=2576308 RepID=A0A4U6QQ03_9ACTN|nr:PQQ-dependent sugar dehydrogenase [Nakamurella flava]